MTTKLEKERKNASYARTHVKALKSWFEFNSIEIRKKIRVFRGGWRLR